MTDQYRQTRIIFRGPLQKETAWDVISKVPLDKDFLVEAIFRVYDEKSRGQEEKYHAMIGCIARQIPWMGKKRDTETWKRLLIEAFVHVKREDAIATNQRDPFNGRGEVVPSLDGQRVVQLGVQSRTFGKRIASEFIEYLYAFGAENNVQWNDRRIYEAHVHG